VIESCVNCKYAEEEASFPPCYQCTGEYVNWLPQDILTKEASDGSTASYYELPENAKELQDLISYKDMNGQIAEIVRACYRYGEVEHSPKLRDAKKIRFYIDAEIERLEKYDE